MAYSLELRQKALEYYEKCKDIKQVCQAFNIDPKTLFNWRRLYERTGSVAHQVKGGHSKRIDRQKLLDYLEKHPDAYQYEIAQHLGCSAPHISYLLKAIGFTRKKKRQPTKNKSLSK